MDSGRIALTGGPNVRDLFNQPLAQPSDLGRPIPDSPHAVSVAMPTWQSVVDYEEEDPEVHQALQCGYPRFFCHPAVRRLFEDATERFAEAGETALVFGSAAACDRCAAFLKTETGDPAMITRTVPWRDARFSSAVLVLPKTHLRRALRYWRYTGEMVSSRQAMAMLAESTDVATDAERWSRGVLERLAGWAGQSSEHGHLYASGMAAIFAAFRAATVLKGQGPTIQLEFPYVDVYCIQKHLGAGGILLQGDKVMAQLEKRLEEGPIRAVFCEVPSNPLNRTVDLPEVSRLCRFHGVPLIVDDTLGTVHNLDVYPYADLVTTSLTKSISGCGDVMAGAVWVSRESPMAGDLQAFLSQDESAPLWVEDAEVLWRNSADFPERMTHINENAEALAAYLKDRPEVEVVYYPKDATRSCYDRIRRPGGGYGGLLSILLHGGESAAKTFYDALQVSKGPSLGTNFTLACPYTLLAHYEELAWAETCGVSRNLIRVAVGMEPIDVLIARFADAFEALA